MACVPLFHSPCPFLESMKGIKAVNGDLNTSICSQSFLQAVCLHTNFSHMNTSWQMMGWAGFGWIPLPVTPGCCTPRPSKPGESGLTLLYSQGEERKQNFLLLTLINFHIFPQRNKHKGKEFCKEHFFTSSDCSLITCQGSASFSQYLLRNCS